MGFAFESATVRIWRVFLATAGQYMKNETAADHKHAEHTQTTKTWLLVTSPRPRDLLRQRYQLHYHRRWHRRMFSPSTQQTLLPPRLLTQQLLSSMYRRMRHQTLCLRMLLLRKPTQNHHRRNSPSQKVTRTSAECLQLQQRPPDAEHIDLPW